MKHINETIPRVRSHTLLSVAQRPVANRHFGNFVWNHYGLLAFPDEVERRFQLKNLPFDQFR